MKEKRSIKPYLSRLRNKYLLTALIFLLWMSFFDNNDFFRQYKVSRKKQELTRELNRRKKLIKETNSSLEQLKDRNQLEKFAREQYLFKRPGEDIFVIVPKD